MTKHIVTNSLMLILFSTVAIAQAPAPPKPGAEQKALAYFVGKWTSAGEVQPGPLGPGGKVTTAETCEAFGGGFHVVCRAEGKGPLGTMTSMGVMSYSAALKAYTVYAVDSIGGNELSTGSKTGATWTFTATSNYGGQSFKSRYTVVETTPSSYTFKWESSADGTKWTTLMEGKATRAAKGT